MVKLAWDGTGERFYETGVDHGVLYIPDAGGAYVNGVAWNGLTSISESPSGAEPNAQYADNIKYLNLISAEEFSATLECLTYPREFEQFDGLGTLVPGVTIGQQRRGVFGLSYRTLVGNDLEGNDHGYKLHLVYGCTASPSEKGYNTVNDSPEPIAFSYEIATTPVAVTGFRPTSVLTVDSRDFTAAEMETLEDFLYGTAGTEPSLPLPDAVAALLGGAIQTVTAQEPAFNAATDTITIPTVAGVSYFINGVEVPAGDVVITEDTIVEARPDVGYRLTPNTDDDWAFDYTP